MPGKTQGEKIDDLLKLTAALTERVDSLRTGFERLEHRLSAATEKVHSFETRLSVLENKVNERYEAWKEWLQRIWMVLGPILGAAVGAFLASR